MQASNADQRKQVVHTLAYSLVLAVVCAAVLTGVGLAVKPLKESNRKADEYRNILRVLGVPFDREAGSSELVSIFEKNVRTVTRGGLDFYEYVPAGAAEPQAVAVPFQGAGLWGPIKGLLAMDPQLTRIRTVSFYEHVETPGLGGEIGKESFRRRFEGKLLVSAEGKPGIRLVRGGRPLADNEVDAISGATLTSSRVQAMLNDVIKRVVEAREKE